MKKILVLTSGGDAPGMNAAIRAVVRSSFSANIEVFGCLSGFQGLIDQTIIPLQPENVANCIQNGGTILKTGRSNAFLKKEVRDQCRMFLDKEKFDGLIVIGGNGSFAGAASLSLEGAKGVIGIPATIDNDIVGTDYTIGFDTARNTALSAIDKIRDTASSHSRNFLVEVMGRSSGFLAVDVGIAGGAEFILTPEFPISITELAERIMKPRRRKLSSIIVVAEGENPGRSVEIGNQLEALTNCPYRVCILGHTQRGGSPTTLDRKTASEMGYRAVEGLINGAKHKIVASKGGELSLIAFSDPSQKPRILDTQSSLLLNNVLCV